MVYLSAGRQSPIQVVTGAGTEQFHWLRPMCYHYTTLPLVASYCAIYQHCRLSYRYAEKICVLFINPVGLPVQVRNSDDLSADVVVKSVDAVGVDETVADPAASPHRLLNVAQDLSIISFIIHVMPHTGWPVFGGK